ncbi:adenosylcobinamide-GDP ribazoletransferase [Parabacteroides sp. PF5-5]|uniref:adenosylcobinamide-GDP ribazoletransferase n=1 Tax=unclassified Parabacteroides TaxID=2649774 RepID=UPI00247412AE|nr:MULTISPECIES: adenosylcobinamide-GDP ribazoletransferase [unclassified Parabacteroides]MDH6305357.1 adenosylcobinamide-GDP ribazoletransferase [Parabacteroides sp. PH5-39]MDH6316710.1 adenosylcobinamide-GDP ribazoletransferase [Parabacteroides sp. PF5-13]MDH6320110.1 adenosylcobinamide-GDP ribazoletransferase [Parabacteroides sp. PH5-13]MDH6323947.1 adenosylcobinamide-GDP ribazoletransferase [Parabacteroides sp. PH5-8]MDH6327787.1 adenosylcobinamide-GDP ribazoletransferase [Parabacteroides 
MQQLLAAFIFFTRLPFWRLANVSSSSFSRVLPFWPLTGWLTAACMVLVLFATSLVLPYGVALLLAMISRLLITGCLHEDGLADFLDGFGGGATQERILAIMKDSHIGTYGVVGLIFYFGLYYTLLSHLPLEIAGSVILAGDPFAKGVSAMIINRLPYARKVEESKSKTLYNPMSAGEYILCLLFACIPLLLMPDVIYFPAIVLPVIVWFLLTSLMKKKIQGYTGDCCGATFLFCELSFYLGILILHTTIA